MSCALDGYPERYPFTSVTPWLYNQNKEAMHSLDAYEVCCD